MSVAIQGGCESLCTDREWARGASGALGAVLGAPVSLIAALGHTGTTPASVASWKEQVVIGTHHVVIGLVALVKWRIIVRAVSHAHETGGTHRKVAIELWHRWFLISV